MTKRHIVRATVNDLIRNNIEIKAKRQHIDLLKVINSGVINLFWEIGMLINHQSEENHTDDKNLLNVISDQLSPVFGNYLQAENLSMMKVFAKKCGFATMSHISAAINWEYMPILLNLENNNAWIFYMELIHTESLAPKQLAKRISESAFEASGEKLNDDKMAFMLSNAKPFYRSTFELYFGRNKGDAFQELFEPKENYKAILDMMLEKNIGNYDIITSIYRKVLDFQSYYNHILNMEFNSFSWEIGIEILRLSDLLQLNKNKVIDDCLLELNKSFPSVFDKTQLSDCLRFATQYRKEDRPMVLLQTVSWSYLRLLLVIDDPKKQHSLACKVFEEGITLQALEQVVLNESSKTEILSHKIKNNKSITQIKTTERNNTLIITEEIVGPIISSKNDLNRNIYKNPELLKFLMRI